MISSEEEANGRKKICKVSEAAEKKGETKLMESK